MADKNYKLSFGMTDGTTKAVTFTAPQGPKGETGATGKDGQDYVLTAADKAEIAEQAAALVEVPEGGGGGAVQADLAENDPNAAGYVKNRTHWVDDPVEVWAETSVALSADGVSTGTTGSVLQGVTLVAGKTYYVKYNEVEYELEALVFPDNGYVGANYIGNPSYFGGNDNGLPFIIGTITGGSAAPVGTTMVVDLAGASSVLLAVYEEGTVHKLNEKFLDVDSDVYFIEATKEADGTITINDTTENIVSAFLANKYVLLRLKKNNFYCIYQPYDYIINGTDMAADFGQLSANVYETIAIYASETGVNTEVISITL